MRLRRFVLETNLLALPMNNFWPTLSLVSQFTVPDPKTPILSGTSPPCAPLPKLKHDKNGDPIINMATLTDVMTFTPSRA